MHSLCLGHGSEGTWPGAVHATAWTRADPQQAKHELAQALADNDGLLPADCSLLIMPTVGMLPAHRDCPFHRRYRW